MPNPTKAELLAENRKLARRIATLERARKKAAALSESRYDIAMRAINEGVYDWDIAKGTIYYSDRVQAATGMDPEAVRTPEDWRSLIHPEDLPVYDRGLIEHFKGRTERFEVEYRYRGPDGAWRWARQHGIAVRNAKGRAVRLIGSTGEITSLKRVEAALKASEERYAVAMRVATEGIYDWDIATGDLYLSDKAREFWGFAPGPLKNTDWLEHLHPEDALGYRQAIVEHFKGRRPHIEHELRVRNAKGEFCWVIDRGIALRDKQGRAIRLVGATSDVTQRKRNEEALRLAHEEATAALERQTATAEILKVIASSPSDVQPVFQVIAQSSMHLVGGRSGVVTQVNGEELVLAAFTSTGTEGDSVLKAIRSVPLADGSDIHCRVVRKAMPEFHADTESDAKVTDSGRAMARARGFRSVLSVPMVRGGVAIGTIGVTRAQPGEFRLQEIGLLKTFADQAVIAIENVRLFNETKESLEQQTAISEILRVISTSPGDVQPVLDAVAERAARICAAPYADVVLREGDTMHLQAAVGLTIGRPTAAENLPCVRSSVMGRSIIDASIMHIADLQDRSNDVEFAYGRSLALKYGHRTILTVPLVREGRALGTIVLRRKEVRPFEDKHINLLRTFADQAAIAIENARLFNETKEALERQTATGEILKVIAESPTDTQPVFDAIARSGARLVNGMNVAILLRQESEVVVMGYSAPGRDDLPEEVRRLPLDREKNFPSQVILDGKVLEIPDWEGEGIPEFERLVAKAYGVKAVLQVPMLRKGEGIGAIVVTRATVGAFEARDIALLRSFADQAVIAIENVRLFNETKEALERQTATAEILKVIASSPSDVQPVFDAIAESAKHLLRGHAGSVTRVVGDSLHLSALTFTSEAGVESYRALFPMPLSSPSQLCHVALRGTTAIRSDTETDPDISPEVREAARAAGYRSSIVVPLLRDGVPIGTINVARKEAGTFSEQQVELLKTFADQAVIAIENVRLFNETKESLERQTATAEILKVIASSPSDVQPVFDTIASSAMQLIEGHSAAVWRLSGGMLHLAALTSTDNTGNEALKARPPVEFIRATANSEAVRSGKPAFISDTENDAEISPALKEIARARGFRSVLAVPMLREGSVVGTITVTRTTPGPFVEHEIDLLRTFGDQAVIAIENVRLFNETTEALEQQTATAEILKVIGSSPTNVQPVFDAIVRSAVRLFEPFNAVIVMREGEWVQIRAGAGDTLMNFDEAKAIFPLPFNPQTGLSSRVMAEAHSLEIPDMETADVLPATKAFARTAGFRSNTLVPLVREGVGIGAISLQHPDPGHVLTDKQMTLVKTFADQAVIAIENVRLFNETKEALERQTATGEILRVIASSPSDVQPVFDAIVRSAARLFSRRAILRSVDSDGLRLRAISEFVSEAHFPPELHPIDRNSHAGRVVLERRAMQVVDTLGPDAPPYAKANAHKWDYRSNAATPLLRDGVAIGLISMLSPEPGELSEKQMALLATFADQAVIAIENVRLFNETKEALEHQRASAEILAVISSSVADTKPVFDKIADSAAQLFSGNHVGITLLKEDGMIHLAAHRGPAAEAFASRFPYTPKPGSAAEIVIKGRRAVQYADVLNDPNVPRSTRESCEITGAKAAMQCPLISKGAGIGMIYVAREYVGAFSDKEMALLKTFADQAVIAIENVRLFKELESRTAALSQSVQKLTALGEVGQAISSTLDLDTVLKTIVSRATQLTGLDGGAIYEFDEDKQEFRLQTSENLAEELVQAARDEPIRLGDGAIGQAGLTREPVQVQDTLADSYQSERKAVLKRVGYRGLLAVPLVREDNLLGALLVTRRAPGAFPEETVALLQTFATQSAMAIQNARLFREIAEKGKELEIASHHKSDFLASMSHELRTPLNAILGFNELILAEIYGAVPEEMKEPLSDIQTSGKHLLRLINNVLDLAKIEAGRMELALADYSVHDTVESVRSTLRPLAAEKGLDFIATVPEDIPIAHGDFGRITQCLMNLAGNSLKFTKVGKVEIAVKLNEGVLIYQVNDTGIGIPPDKISSLFTEFKQTDATIASEYGGTGLGLSISKKFIEMHGGRVWVESEVGKGSSFIFEVPLRAGDRKEAGS